MKKEIKRITWHSIRQIAYQFLSQGSHRYLWHVSQAPESPEAYWLSCIVMTQLPAGKKKEIGHNCELKLYASPTVLLILINCQL